MKNIGTKLAQNVTKGSRCKPYQWNGKIGWGYPGDTFDTKNLDTGVHHLVCQEAFHILSRKSIMGCKNTYPHHIAP
jgi:hypothetical protein